MGRKNPEGSLRELTPGIKPQTSRQNREVTPEEPATHIFSKEQIMDDDDDDFGPDGNDELLVIDWKYGWIAQLGRALDF